MARWMCSISLSDGNTVGRISHEQVRVKLGIDSISEVMLKGRLRWFGHVERMERES